LFFLPTFVFYVEAAAAIDLTTFNNNTQAIVRSGIDATTNSNTNVPPQKKQKTLNKSKKKIKKKPQQGLQFKKKSSSSSSSSSARSGSNRMEKPPTYAITNISIPSKDLRTFSTTLFDPNIDGLKEDAAVETKRSGSSSMLPHFSKSFQQHQKFGFPEVLLTWNGF
jgi:hypothetical protein